MRFLFLLLLLTPMAWAQRANEAELKQGLMAGLKGYGMIDSYPAYCKIIDQMLHFQIPNDCAARLLENGDSGGGRKMTNLCADALSYLENLSPGIENAGGSGRMAEFEPAFQSLVPKFSLTYIYEGPSTEQGWVQGMKHLSTVEGRFLYKGWWTPQSGVAHITVRVTAKVKAPSAQCSDGQHFQVVAPAGIDCNPEVWDKTVQPVFDRFKKN